MVEYKLTEINLKLREFVRKIFTEYATKLVELKMRGASKRSIEEVEAELDKAMEDYAETINNKFKVLLSKVDWATLHRHLIYSGKKRQ